MLFVYRWERKFFSNLPQFPVFPFRIFRNHSLIGVFPPGNYINQGNVEPGTPSLMPRATGPDLALPASETGNPSFFFKWNTAQNLRNDQEGGQYTFGSYRAYLFLPANPRGKPALLLRIAYRLPCQVTSRLFAHGVPKIFYCPSRYDLGRQREQK